MDSEHGYKLIDLMQKTLLDKMTDMQDHLEKKIVYKNELVMVKTSDVLKQVTLINSRLSKLEDHTYKTVPKEIKKEITNSIIDLQQNQTTIEKKLEDLQSQTVIGRWFERNPKRFKVIIIFVGILTTQFIGFLFLILTFLGMDKAMNLAKYFIKFF